MFWKRQRRYGKNLKNFIISHISFKCSRRNLILDLIESLKLLKSVEIFLKRHIVYSKTIPLIYYLKKKKRFINFAAIQFLPNIGISIGTKVLASRFDIFIGCISTRWRNARPCEVYQVGQDLRSPDIPSGLAGSSQRSGKKNRPLHRELVKVEQRPRRLYYAQLWKFKRRYRSRPRSRYRNHTIRSGSRIRNRSPVNISLHGLKSSRIEQAWPAKVSIKKRSNAGLSQLTWKK